MDWVPPHGPWDDQLSFVFDAGILDSEAAAALRPHDEELSELAFVAPDKAAKMFEERLRRRFQAALRALADGATAYLYDGRPLGKQSS
ncbi:hypothetical protein [Streptomyces sp. NPDC046985]|uniref:hypothetical protein n=1 Tax=Streptomyces sp. NPDC046985 TaxID=3155377 RepID=UPI0033CDB943